MGYYTHFSLQVLDPATQLVAADANELIDALREEVNYARTAFMSNGETSESCKWYGHKDDMSWFSKQHPDRLFVLSGKGEEADDLWRTYFLNGKSQVARAVINYEPFSPEKLSD